MATTADIAYQKLIMHILECGTDTDPRRHQALSVIDCSPNPFRHVPAGHTAQDSH